MWNTTIATEVVFISLVVLEKDKITRFDTFTNCQGLLNSEWNCTFDTGKTRAQVYELMRLTYNRN
jgi:hypothetical protein